MPLPLLFIVPAAVTGLTGAGKTIKAGLDSTKANKINKNANYLLEFSKERLERGRKDCADSLNKLGDLKLTVLNTSVGEFLETFEQIKNVDFTDSVGLDELNKMHIDKVTFSELKDLRGIAASVAGGAAAGVAGGAATAFGAYGAAQLLATASTGTAISTLSGAAATNATLAFFGGGSLAAGGMGMAGGAMVLGGIVAGPALLVMGLIVGGKAEKKLEDALANEAEAKKISEELNTAAVQCESIRRRTNMFYVLMSRLDSYFVPMVYKMEDIVKNEGYDYSKYQPDSKKIIASAASLAVSIKTVLDTPILTEEGMLTEDSEVVIKRIADTVAGKETDYKRYLGMSEA